MWQIKCVEFLYLISHTQTGPIGCIGLMGQGWERTISGDWLVIALVKSAREITAGIRQSVFMAWERKLVILSLTTSRVSLSLRFGLNLALL